MKLLQSSAPRVSQGCNHGPEANAVAVAHRPALRCEIPGCGGAATQSTLCFNIFNSAPHAVLRNCSRHNWQDYHGLFRCENCERLIVGQSGYERHKVELHGDLLCLDCAAKRHFRLPQSWIEPRAVNAVVQE